MVKKTITDIEVRVALKLPSLDCLLTRARLRYLGRILRTQPASLCALLSIRHRARLLGWTALVIKDLKIAWQQVALCKALPDPELRGSECLTFINEIPHWWKQVAATASSATTSPVPFWT